MKKRIEVSLADGGSKIQFRGVDETRQPFHLFKQIKVEGLTPAPKMLPSAQQTKQPYKLTLPEEASRPS